MLTKKKKTTPSEIVEVALKNEHEIRPFPESVSRLIEAMKKPDSSAQTLADIVEIDIAFSTRILRVVNSPMFGMANEIRSIRQATTILGQKALKNLALSYAGSQIISGDGIAKAERAALWEHSLGCATVARTLCDFVPGINPEDAFLAGVFHDIGKLFFLEVIPEEYCTLDALWTGGAELQAQESELCGCLHTQAGLKLALLWPLPDAVKAAVHYHHSPEQDMEDSRLTRLIHVANGLARLVGIGSPKSNEADALDKAEEFFSLSQNQIQDSLVRASEAFSETRQSYS